MSTNNMAKLKSSTILELQTKILDIITYFDQFCKTHNIDYYLMGGSALGALRHKGFIPWDDDLDVFMTSDNYFKFLKIAPDSLDHKKFYLQQENTLEWPMFFTKLRLNGTTFIENDTKNSNMHQGIFIDIMCLNNVSNNPLLRYGQYISARLLTARTLSSRGYNVHGSFVKKTSLLISNLLVRGFVKDLLIKVVRSYNSHKSKQVGHFFGKAPYSKTCFPIEWLGEQRYVSFELIKLPVPCECEKYLHMRFGDFMKLPSESTLKDYPIHALFVDVNKDYKEYRNVF